ncbi:MAG: MFS transporter [Acidimicrobiales bacterium]
MLSGVARGLLAPVYGPWVGMSLCLGMISVALPLYLSEVGLSYVALTAVLAAVGVGSAVGGVPAGDAVARFGPRRTLMFGVSAIGATVALLAATDNFVVLFGLQLVAGVGAIALRISGQTWIALTVEPGLRGRFLSTMGGTRRFGMFVGPFMGGVIIERFGFSAVFVVSGALAAVGLVPLLTADPVEPVPKTDKLPLREVFRRHWRLLLLATAGPILIMAARRGRNVVLPLIGDDLGMSPAAVGLMVSIGTGADLVLFPVAGYVMDNMGRLMAIIPAFCLMGCGLFLLAFADSGAMVAVAGGVIGVGNGLSAGTMMTLGADLAPEDSTSQFLAGFASLQDWGSIFGPLMVGWVAAAVGLGASAAVLGALIFLGVALIVRNVGETGARRPVPA